MGLDLGRGLLGLICPGRGGSRQLGKTWPIPISLQQPDIGLQGLRLAYHDAHKIRMAGIQ